jgi:hypothetical protein
MNIDVKVIREPLSEDVVLMLRAENMADSIALSVLVLSLEKGYGQIRIDRKEYDENGAVKEVVFETAPEPDPAE